MGEKAVFKDRPEKRELLGELLKTLDEKTAIRKLNLGKTPGRIIDTWKRKGLYPYDTPDVVQVNDTVVQQSVFQNNDSVVQPVVDEMLMGKIEQLVNDAVEARIQSIRTELQSSSNVAKTRPKLKRTQEDTIPTSFRFPSALLRKARVQAKKDRTSLNALVETFLFEYIGCPADLLEE
jgi:hypothetical protein